MVIMPLKRILSIVIFILILVAFLSVLKRSTKELEINAVSMEVSSETSAQDRSKVLGGSEEVGDGLQGLGETIDNVDSLANIENINKKEVVSKPAVQTTKLSIPYHSQQYKNSCEAASLKMALEYRGIKVSEMDILQKFGYAPRMKDVEKNEWDDPQKMYVGFVDIVGSTIGYGVYGLPVVKAVESFGRQAEYTTNVTSNFLAKNIKAGNPIILWGYTSFRESPYTWNTPDGNTVKAFKGEHARLVVGVVGGDVDGNNPKGFYVHDPFNGQKYQYWSTESLMAQVNAVPGVTNQAVVVK